MTFTIIEILLSELILIFMGSWLLLTNAINIQGNFIRT